MTTDLRMPLLGLGAWAGALLARWQPGVVWPIALAVLAGLVAAVPVLMAVRRPSRRRAALTALAVLAVAAGVGLVALLRAEAVRAGPVATAAQQRALVTLTGTVAGDGRRIQGRFGGRVLVRLAVGRHQPVLVFGDDAWEGVAIGQRVRFSGRLAPVEDADDLAATVTSRGPPQTVAAAGPAWGATEALRASIRDAVAHRPDSQRALVPALVDGDDAGMPPGLVADFRTTGLTHLTAVSGTNLTLVLGFLLVAARWLGVVGVAGIVGFVLLARTEPSVLRAAAMGTVALVGLGRGGWHRGVRGLGAAVVGLLLLEPGLAATAGFALSVLATAGILLVAPSWRDALARWLPRWLAEAVAVPAAAQLACTPLVAALSGQVSLVAVAANLVVAPVVGPATVLGLMGGLVTLVWSPAGQLVGAVAGWCVAWIVVVAERGAALPTAAITWGTGPLALTVLTLLCAMIAVVAPRVLARRTTGLACSALLVIVVLVRVPTPGWPPAGWLMVACDVGQGDGLVLDTGIAHTAVVVD